MKGTEWKIYNLVVSHEKVAECRYMVQYISHIHAAQSYHNSFYGDKELD